MAQTETDVSRPERSCPDCDSFGGRSVAWDDDRGIRHEDWADCSTCDGTGFVPIDDRTAMSTDGEGSS